MVPPPNTQTVKKTISRVVVNIICRAEVAVSRIARANAIAPRKPGKVAMPKLLHTESVEISDIS